MTSPEQPSHADRVRAERNPLAMTRPDSLRRTLERTTYLAAFGSVLTLLLCAATFAWASTKAIRFVQTATSPAGSEDALVYLFESIDTVLAGVVLLRVGLGLWELCVGELQLPASLVVSSFYELEAKVAGTLVLVLVVRFLEELVQSPAPDELLAIGVSITLVGGLLVVFARWRH